MKPNHFEVYIDEAGEGRYRFRYSNGEIGPVSEGYAGSTPTAALHRAMEMCQLFFRSIKEMEEADIRIEDK